MNVMKVMNVMYVIDVMDVINVMNVIVFIDDMDVINAVMYVDLVSCLGVEPGLLSSVEDWLWLAGLGLSLLGLLGEDSNCIVLYCTVLYIIVRKKYLILMVQYST